MAENKELKELGIMEAEKVSGGEEQRRKNGIYCPLCNNWIPTNMHDIFRGFMICPACGAKYQINPR